MKVKVKVTQSCPTLCGPMDYTVHGILQAWILEWVAFPFSRGSFQPRDRIQVSHIAGGFFTSWGTREAQEYWSGWPIHSPGDLPNPGIKFGSSALQVDSFQLSYEGNLSIVGNLKCHSLWLPLPMYTFESLCLNGELHLSQYWTTGIKCRVPISHLLI